MFIQWLFRALIVVSLAGSFSLAEAVGPEDVNVEYLPEWEMKTTVYGGKLLLSDSPEMVSGDGILYQDTVVGDVRLFFYHVNAAHQAKKFDVLLENRGNGPARIAVRQFGLGGPGYGWMAMGKEANMDYLNGSEPYTVEIPAGGSRPLLSTLSETAMLPNMLINGIFDFTADQPVTVKVMMLPLLEESVAFSRIAKVLPPDRYYLRGTFAGADRELVATSAYDPEVERAVAVTLGDNKFDRFLAGIDATTRQRVVNYGNYGVVYHITLPTVKRGKIAYYLAPRGGDYAGAICVDHPDAYWSPLDVPAGRLHFGADKTRDFAFLGTYDGGEPLKIKFTPPGGSNLPIKILIISQ